MIINYDKSADALYIKVKRGKIHKTEELESLNIDLDKKGAIVGIEFLNYSKRVPAPERESISVVGQQRFLIPTG